jgi:hypothetical protein
MSGRDEMLYTFALDCAQHKQNKSCQFICYKCASNISIYGIDKEYAVMLQHMADLEIVERKEASRRVEDTRKRKNNARKAEGRVLLIAFGLLLVLGFFSVCFISRKKPPVSIVLPPEQEQIFQLPKPPDWDKPEPPELIDWTNQTLKRIYRVDMNGDGKINCIDYTLQFWQAYPNQDHLRIIWFYNPATKFSHLFIKAGDFYTEPQAELIPRYYTFGYKTLIHDVGAYWGIDLDMQYMYDVTDNFDIIKYNQFKWSVNNGN